MIYVLNLGYLRVAPGGRAFLVEWWELAKGADIDSPEFDPIGDCVEYVRAFTDEASAVAFAETKAPASYWFVARVVPTTFVLVDRGVYRTERDDREAYDVEPVTEVVGGGAA